VFQDLESGRERHVGAQAARTSYLERFSERAAPITRACGRLGIDDQRMTTDRPLELALFDFLNSRLRRGRTVRPHDAARSGRNDEKTADSSETARSTEILVGKPRYPRPPWHEDGLCLDWRLTAQGPSR
jgi:hypothetical protein